MCPPSRFDPAPYGVICYVHGEDRVEGYIQLSDDESQPQWMPIGDFLWSVFASELENDEFIDECLKKYYESLT